MLAAAPCGGAVVQSLEGEHKDRITHGSDSTFAGRSRDVRYHRNVCCTGRSGALAELWAAEAHPMLHCDGKGPYAGGGAGSAVPQALAHIGDHRTACSVLD